MSEMLKKRLIFWARLLSWIAVGCGLPIGVFTYKFGLFKDVTVQYDALGNVISRTSYMPNGWGIVSILLIGSFISSILKEVVEASGSGYTLTKQVYSGLSKTMPLVIAFGVCYFLNGVLDRVMFCLAVLILCRLVSIPLNPLPKWKYEKLGKEDYSTVSEALTKFVKSHIGGGSNG